MMDRKDLAMRNQRSFSLEFKKQVNEGCQIYNYEEREAGNPGCMPHMWDQDVQDRKELKPRLWMSGVSMAG